MERKLGVEILHQPDDLPCGPTCLHALYRYFGERPRLGKIIGEVPMLEGGGTLDVLLINHALGRGYSAGIYTYNVQMFDPTWFGENVVDIAQRLQMQLEHKESQRLRVATEAYLRFLEHGGELRFEELTSALIRKYLSREIPILTGLSATYLYGNAREFGPEGRPADVHARPAGHFVLLCGYDREKREVLVADPLGKNPLSPTHQYMISIDRVICSILLGILTYDANLLIIEPRRKRGKSRRRADSHRRQ